VNIFSWYYNIGLKIKQTSFFAHVRISNLRRFLYLAHCNIYTMWSRHIYKTDNIIYSLNLHNSICFQSARICIIKRTTIAYYNVTYEQFNASSYSEMSRTTKNKKIRFIKPIHSFQNLKSYEIIHNLTI